VKKFSLITVPLVVSGLVVLGCQAPQSNPLEVGLSGISASRGGPNGNPSANGGGTALEGTEKSTFTFNAIQHDDGSVNGHLVYQFRLADLRIQMDIDCLNIIGTRAALSGVVTDVTGEPPSYIFVGQHAVFTVQDNGEGHDAPPDLFSDVILFPAATCHNPFPVPYIAMDGNVQVNP